MIRTTIIIPTDILEAVADQMQKTPGLMRTAWKRDMGRIKSQILTELRQQPGKPHYPIRWKSERQRKFVMAKLRRENNIPYQRTNRLSRGWQIELLDTTDGGIMQVHNDVPYADFVQGDSAQPFHLDTGWIQSANVIVKYEDIAQERLIQTWFTIADPLAGIPG